MAVGEVFTKNNCKRAICLMTGQTANTSVPSTDEHGVPNYPTGLSESSDVGAGYRGQAAESSTLLIRSTDGLGTLVATFVLWGYLAASGAWYPIAVNGGAALAEFSANQLYHREVFEYLGHFDRLFLELKSVGGDAALKASLDLDTPSVDLDTIIEATTAGEDGNSITIAAVDDGTGTGTLTRDGTDFTFHFEDAVTTVGDFEALVAALAGADDLIAVKTGGTGATVLVTADAFEATPLAGGTNANTIEAYLVTHRQGLC